MTSQRAGWHGADIAAVLLGSVVVKKIGSNIIQFLQQRRSMIVSA